MLINDEDIEWLKQMSGNAYFRHDPIPVDECHSGLYGLKGAPCKRFFLYLLEQPGHVFLCDGDELIPFAADAFVKLSQNNPARTNATGET